MKKQNKIYLTIGVVTIILLASIVMFSTQERDEEVIKIGAIYPLSGPFASYGIEYKRGLEMAVKEINSEGGILGRQIKLIFEDDQGDPTQSVTALNKLINIDNVNYIFTGFSSTSQATAPIAQQNEVLYISATVSKIGETGNFIFRDYWDMEDQGEITGKAILNEGFDSVGIIALNYGDTEFFLRGLKSQAENVRFVEERFNFGDSDFRTQLTRLKNANVEAILVYGFPGAETITITNQIKELGLDNNIRLIGASQYGFYFMYSQFSETLEKMGVIDSWYSLDENNPRSVDFTEKYRQIYGEELIGDAAYPYDGLYALKIAIENAGDSKDIHLVSEKLLAVNIVGAAGPLSFDNQGNSLRDAYLQTFIDGTWEKYVID